MNKGKIGRNDPCPCGSGKKYKNCCLSLEGIVSYSEKPFVRYNQLISSVKLKLDAYYQSEIRKIRKSAQDRFLRLCIEHHLLPQQEPAFSDWLWFDLTDEDNMTMGQEYEKEHGEFMDQPLRECLKALNQSFMSLYEVKGMEGELLRVNDILTGQNYPVLLKEPLDIEVGQVQLLMLGRLVTMSQGNIFSGVVFQLKNDDRQADFITRHFDYLQTLKPGIDKATLLKQHGEILVGLFDHANGKEMLGLNDIRVVRPLADTSSVAAGLDQSAGFKWVHTTAGIRWYDLLESHGPCRVGLSSHELIAQADLLDDVISLQNILESILPTGKWGVVNSLFLFEPPAPEFNEVWFMVVKEQETERWLKTTHQELDNKSPEELLEDEQGKARLMALLEEFAGQVGNNEYTLELVKYMRQRVSGT